MNQLEANAKNEHAQKYTKSFDFISIGFVTFLKGFLTSAFESIGQVVFLPFFVFTFSIYQTILAWQRTHIDKENGRVKPNHLIKALVYTASTLAIGVVSVGVFVSSALLSMLSPFLLVAAFAAKTLYDGVNSIYYAYKAYKEEDADQKIIFKEKAKTHAYLALGGIIMTAAMTAAYLISFVPLKIAGGVLGLFAGFFMACYSFGKVLTVKPKVVKPIDPTVEPLLNPITPINNAELKRTPSLSLRGSITGNGFVVNSTPATPQNAAAVSETTLKPFASPEEPTAPIDIAVKKMKEDPSEMNLVDVGSFASRKGAPELGTPLSMVTVQDLERSSTARMKEQLGIVRSSSEAELCDAPSVENMAFGKSVSLEPENNDLDPAKPTRNASIQAL